VQHVETPHDISDLIRENPVVIALFGRGNCPECEYVYKRLERFVARRSEYVVRYVDLDRHPTLASMHVVHELPTTIVHVYGSQISKQVGGIDLPKLRRDVDRVLEQMRSALEAEEAGSGSAESE
jgi:thioredoxin-like negative regulator of GroEL